MSSSEFIGIYKEFWVIYTVTNLKIRGEIWEFIGKILKMLKIELPKFNSSFELVTEQLSSYELNAYGTF